MIPFTPSLLTRASANGLHSRRGPHSISQGIFRLAGRGRAVARLSRESGRRVRRCILRLVVRSNRLAHAAHAVAASITLIIWLNDDDTRDITENVDEVFHVNWDR